MTILNYLARPALILLAGFGTFAGVKLSIEHIQHGEICPMLGPIPACFIVFVGYLCVVLSAVLINKPFSSKLFYAGWTPVFLLALMGVSLELTQGHICPPGGFGIPQCFYSLAMALICLGAFRLSYNSAKSV